MNWMGEIEKGMYLVGQVFLFPVQTLILLLFIYALLQLGNMLHHGHCRLRKQPKGYELLHLARGQPDLSLESLEAEATRRLEGVRIATRLSPILGLAATMMSMGPALRALGEGQLGEVSQSLSMAFSAVIVALISSAITYVLTQIRRRWYVEELVSLQAQGRAVV